MKCNCTEHARAHTNSSRLSCQAVKIIYYKQIESGSTGFHKILQYKISLIFICSCMCTERRTYKITQALHRTASST